MEPGPAWGEFSFGPNQYFLLRNIVKRLLDFPRSGGGELRDSPADGLAKFICKLLPLAGRTFTEFLRGAGPIIIDKTVKT